MFDNRAPAFQHSANSRLVRVPDWPQLPKEIKLYKTSMVAQDSRGIIYVAHRGDHPLFSLNPDGSFRSYIGEDVIKKSDCWDLRDPAKPVQMETIYYLHGLHVDPWDNLWVTDVGRHLIMGFDPKGALNLVLGEDGKSGCDEKRFGQPTHAFVVPTGEIFVADGYGNSRVVKLTREGKFIKQWGTRGTAPGHFHTPHVIALGPDGKLYVGDRENDRVQIFDQEGRHLGIWPNLHSMDGICVAPDGRIYGAAGVDHAVIEFGPGGQFMQVWADPAQGDYPDRRLNPYPDVDYPHGILVDAEGAIYLAETTVDPNGGGSRLLKFRVKPNG